MTSQDAAWVRLPDGRAAASACRRCCPGHCGGCRRHLSALHEVWGATGQGLGVLEVGGAFVQYAQPLVSGSRPSWSRPTRADSGRSRRRTMTTGTLCRQRAGSGGGGPMTEASGCAVRTPDSLLRGLVSTALTLPSLPANHPAEIVGILRFFLGEQSRLGVNVSAVDTDAPPDLFPSSCPRFQGHRPAQGSCPSGCLRSHDTHVSQK